MGLIRQVILLCALLAASAKLSSSQDSGSGHQCYIGLAGQTPAPGTCTVATTQCAKLEKDGEAAYACGKAEVQPEGCSKQDLNGVEFNVCYCSGGLCNDAKQLHGIMNLGSLTIFALVIAFISL